MLHRTARTRSVHKAIPFNVIGISVRTILPPVICKTVTGMFKPRAFGVVFRMVLHCAAIEVANIAVIGCSLCGSGTGQTAIAAQGNKRYCVHSIDPYHQTTHRRQPSRYGQHGQGVNGGSVKSQQVVSVASACVSYRCGVVVVTLWSYGVNKCKIAITKRYRECQL